MKKGERANQKLYVALKELDLCFTHQEVEDVIYLWNEGQPFKDIYKYVVKKYNGFRTVNELACLIMDLNMNERIEERKYGLHDNTSVMGGNDEDN